MERYEKEDIVRRAIVPEDEWVNPFPSVEEHDLQVAEKNLKIILADVRRAKMVKRYARLEAEAEFRRAERYLD
jgi:hypothetical protein